MDRFKSVIQTLFLMLLGFSALSHAEGPRFHHKDPAVQQEFENVYQDLRTVLNSSGTVRCIDNPTFCVDVSNDQVLIASGSVANPGMAFSADPDTGLYWGGSGILQVAGNGSRLAKLEAAGAGAINTLNLYNSDNTNAASHARLYLETGGTSSGDPFALFTISGAAVWAVGIDNSDSDRFKISNNSTLGNNDYLIIDTVTTGVSISGTNTNDDACATCVGFRVSSATSNQTSAAATGHYGDLVSIALTAGDWDVSAGVVWTSNGATWTVGGAGVSTTAGDNSAGLTTGDSYFASQFASSSTTPLLVPLSIPTTQFKLATATTIRLKIRADYSANGPPKAVGRIEARRVR